MTYDILLAFFIMGVGLCTAGLTVHFYQLIWRVPAILSYSGKTYLSSLGSLFMSFIFGPYIMLNMGWKREDNGNLSFVSILISAFVAFGWAFISGLLILAIYLSVF